VREELKPLIKMIMERSKEHSGLDDGLLDVGRVDQKNRRGKGGWSDQNTDEEDEMVVQRGWIKRQSSSGTWSVFPYLPCFFVSGGLDTNLAWSEQDW
jgi:hypothetical protein